MQIQKRDGKLQEYAIGKIERAITQASEDSILGVDINLVRIVANKIDNWVKQLIDIVSVEDIQDKVEEFLMESERKDIAKSYIIYRQEREKERINKKEVKNQLLSDEFISKYKHIEPPMTELGKFVYYRTYSRWIPEYNRREYWWETVRRAVEYNCSLLPTSKEEAEKLYDDIFNLKQFPAGRVLWVGGTDITKKNSLSTMNCAAVVIDNFEKFSELFYCLLVGAGVGFLARKDNVELLPKIRKDVRVIHKAYFKKEKSKRKESTSIIFNEDNSMVTIEIGDSKESWADSLEAYFKILYSHKYRHIKEVIVDYDNIRLKGEPLSTFGGYSSGYESLRNMYVKIEKVIKNVKGNKLRPIDVIDIANIIGENVVVGGVRRTAELGLIDQYDVESVEAKKDLYIYKDGEWVSNDEISHRAMSNNTILYRDKPTLKQWSSHFEQMLNTGEPGYANEQAALKRNPNFKSGNACFEILLDDRQVCNLTTINVMGFVEDGELNKDKLLESLKLNSRMGYRMTAIDLELPEWNRMLHRDRLCGVSHTGWMDMINATNMSKEEEVELLKIMKEVVKKAIKDVAIENNLNESLLSTALKPSGTLSLLPVVSPGLHYSYSDYYIRRVRVSKDDPLTQVAIDLEWEVKPVDTDNLDSCNMVAIEFPVKAPEGRTVRDVSAIEQLENYKRQMDYYVEHNVSATIMVRPDEWEETKMWVYDHWEDCVALTFMPLDDHFYPLAPYEEIDKEEYEKRVSKMKKFTPSLVNKYEVKKYDHDIGEDDSCSTGACPVR